MFQNDKNKVMAADSFSIRQLINRQTQEVVHTHLHPAAEQCEWIQVVQLPYSLSFFPAWESEACIKHTAT